MLASLVLRAPLVLPVLSMLAVAAAGSAPAHANSWVFDKQHTNVSFTWNRLGISRQTGRIVDVDGRVVFDPEDVEKASVDVTMRVASVWTGVEALDRHLRSPDFFDATRHPAITFRSTSARRT